MKLTHFVINNKDRSKISENFLTRSSFDEKTYIKNITRLLDSLNNNYGNFCPSCSNDDSISSLENRLQEYYHLSYIFFIKVCYYDWPKKKNSNFA